MSTSLIRGKYVICKVTGPGSAVVVDDGAVYQEDGVIVEVDGYDKLRERHAEAEVIGSPRHVVMPGLVNDHFHVGITPFQLGVPDLPLGIWGAARIGVKSLDPYLDQLYGAIQMIETGTTTVQAIHGGGQAAKPMSMETADRAISGYLESGMRVSYAPTASDIGALISGGTVEELAATLPTDLARRFTAIMASAEMTTEDWIGLMGELASKYGEDRYSRVRISLAPSMPHRTTDALLVAMKEMAARYKTGIHIHLQESMYQKLYGQRLWGKTPLQHLDDLGFLGPELVCGHSVWTTEEDIDLMAATGTNVCHNASSNLRLQSGIAPVGALLQKGIRVAIGSDEAGINDDKDLFQEMRLVLKLHRVPGIDNVPPTSHQVFQMATENGAYAASFGDLVGALEPGKRADIVLLNLQNIEEPFIDPEVSIVDAVVHRGRSLDVDTVLVDGEVVMRDGRLTKVDKEAFYRELRTALDRPYDSWEAERREVSRQVVPHLFSYYGAQTPNDLVPHTVYNARR